MFSPLLALEWNHYLFSIPLSLLSVFLMLVILVQRGRGGGLTGALGGMGGQSAFGTKAGDLFTKITIAVAAIWILLSMAALKVLNTGPATAGLGPSTGAPVRPGADAAKDTDKTPSPITAGEKAPRATDGKQATDAAPASKGTFDEPAATAPATTPPASTTTPAPTSDATSPPPATPNE